MLKRVLTSTLFRLFIAVIVGIITGEHLNDTAMSAIVVVKHITSQLIMFMVPLIVFSFVCASITKMGAIASKMLTMALILAYSSSICAALLAMSIGYEVIPKLDIPTATDSSTPIPEMLFTLNIPPIMSVMTALTLAIIVGLSAIWIRSQRITNLLSDLQKMVLEAVNRILIPILPTFIAANFCALSYEGSLTRQLPIFINIIGIVLATHLLWLVTLYALAAVTTRQNSLEVLRHYAPAYLTAVGTMSSAATLPVALRAAKRSKILNPRIVDFSIPIFSNIHLCGSIITEVLFVMTISKLLYGVMIPPTTMVLFIALLGIFAVGAPGVPGGTVIASLGIVSSVLGFSDAGTALLLTIFALQDSFGTACNIVGDGALTMIMNRYSTSIKV